MVLSAATSPTAETTIEDPFLFFWILLHATPFDPANGILELETATAGGLSVFLGMIVCNGDIDAMFVSQRDRDLEIEDYDLVGWVIGYKNDT